MHTFTCFLGYSLSLAALDSLRARTVDVMFRNPALIVRLSSDRTSGNSRSISTNDADLILWRNSLLASSRRALGTLSALATSASLRKQSLDPGLVDEVKRTEEAGEKEEVKENTIGGQFLYIQVRKLLTPVGREYWLEPQ